MFTILMVWFVFGLSALPLVLFFMNRGVFTRAPHAADGAGASAEAPIEVQPRISVLIPARNEAGGIEAACRAILASTGIELELLVMDDHSTDGTADIVRGLAATDPRVRLLSSPALPEGWAGKQHACFRLAEAATMDRFVWMDADVRLTPDALSRMARFQEQSGADLVSGFPRQITESVAEKLVVPQINLVLLGYLPMMMMRMTTKPSFAAANGQWIMATRSGYEATGGHGAESVRGSFHDGVKLPRLFRTNDLKTDVFDGTDTATCRMYRNASEVWRGFAKNATEGMAGPVAVWVWTVLLLGGHVVPWLLLLAHLTGLYTFGVFLIGAVAWSVAMSAVVNLWCAAWFRQGWLVVLLRPFGIATLIAIQWYAWANARLGRRPEWRGRSVEAA